MRLSKKSKRLSYIFVMLDFTLTLDASIAAPWGFDTQKIDEYLPIHGSLYQPSAPWQYNTYLACGTTPLRYDHDPALGSDEDQASSTPSDVPNQPAGQLPFAYFGHYDFEGKMNHSIPVVCNDADPSQVLQSTCSPVS